MNAPAVIERSNHLLPKGSWSRGVKSDPDALTASGTRPSRTFAIACSFAPAFEFNGGTRRFPYGGVSMDIATLLVDGVILLVIVAVIVSLVRAWRARPAQLKPLTLEARTRYVDWWNRIESRFVDAPEEAVREAESLVTSLLSERGHPLGHDRLPRDMRAAGRKRRAREGHGGTEDLRRAMLHYRAVYTRMIGPAPNEEQLQGRRETA
jgi:hypothetical protein